MVVRHWGQGCNYCTQEDCSTILTITRWVQKPCFSFLALWIDLDSAQRFQILLQPWVRFLYLFCAKTKALSWLSKVRRPRVVENPFCRLLIPSPFSVELRDFVKMRRENERQQHSAGKFLQFLWLLLVAGPQNPTLPSRVSREILWSESTKLLLLSLESMRVVMTSYDFEKDCTNSAWESLHFHLKKPGFWPKNRANRGLCAHKILSSQQCF